MTRPNAVYVTFIKAPAQAVWDALTSPETSKVYFFGYSIEAGAAAGEPYLIRKPDGSLDVDGQVLVREEPAVLRVYWKMAWDIGEPLAPADIEYRIEAAGEGCVKLTISEFHHGHVADKWIEAGRNGWSLIMAGLKTLLETGQPLGAIEMNPPV